MKKLLSILVLITLSIGAFSQTQTFFLEGFVYDENDVPMTGATVVDSKLNTSFIVDENGHFKIKTRIGDKLSISFLGYATATVEVKSDKQLIVDMTPDKSYKLTEATVVGYSKQERRDITGAVSSVKFKETSPSLSVDQLLQGQAPGVFVSTSSGSLGAANLLTIRGISSIMGDNNPLYVVEIGRASCRERV